MTEEDYYQDFMQDVYARSGAEENFSEVKFTEVMCDFLVEQAILESYDLAYHKQTKQGVRLDAWNYNKEKQTLNLLVTDFSPEPEMRSLTTADADTCIRRLERFFANSLNDSFFRSLEEAFPAHGVARDIFENSKNIARIEFCLLTNAKLSERFKSIKRSEKEGYECSYDIWDIGRRWRIFDSGKEKEDIVIDLTDFVDSGIPCLPAFTGSDVCKSYLLALPGDLLATIYDRYGERLLEQNVRTFLQFRGGVNKGIRNTIQNEPDMFFAYNNGLTVTAESVEFSENMMQSITNMQIVNGGQTTASLFMTKRLDKEKKVDLSKVHIQVKLSVIDPDKVDEVVPEISKCANTQNKVNAADFFSNHPFHRRIEDFSRRILAPSVDGSLVETHWYYERARGQYANQQAKMSDRDKKKFLIQNPKPQMFTKTDLAKYENSFALRPDFVSKGAQWNFGKFAERISGKDGNTGMWDKNESHFNELYFKRLIAKAIIFRFLDKNLMAQKWYSGYKANIVTYTLAKFAQMVSDKHKYIDFMAIWKTQKLSSALESQLLSLAKIINDTITDTELNVTQYCKQQACWQRIEKLSTTLSPDVLQELLESEENDDREKDAKRGQKILKGIEAQVYVFEKGQQYWIAMIEWGDSTGILLDSEISFLTAAYKTTATEKQCPQIMRIEQRALSEGFHHK
tara:strand:+ start:5015 stop:7063 length:2049 start_codon:yes stop_codon:yes gene_type:complete